MQTRIPVIALTILAVTGCATDQKKLSGAQVQIDDLRAQVATLRAENQRLHAQLDDSARPATPYLSGYKLKFPEFGLGVRLTPEANPTIGARSLHLNGPTGGWTVTHGVTQTIDMIETASPATKPATAKQFFPICLTFTRYLPLFLLTCIEPRRP